MIQPAKRTTPLTAKEEAERRRLMRKVQTRQATTAAETRRLAYLVAVERAAVDHMEPKP